MNDPILDVSTLIFWGLGIMVVWLSHWIGYRAGKKDGAAIAWKTVKDEMQRTKNSECVNKPDGN